MKTILLILFTISLPAGMLILTSISGAASFGATFLICFVAGYVASKNLSKDVEL